MCHYHGGAAPQVIAAAKLRLACSADAAVKTLVEILTKRRGVPSARVSVAIAVLDRAGLSVRQVMEHVGEGGGPIQAEVIHRLQGARERLQVHDNKELEHVAHMPEPEQS